MSDPTSDPASIPSASRRFAPAGAVFALLGLILFAYFVRRASLAEIVEGLRRLGSGFLLILSIAGARFLIRSLAWTHCLEAPHRLHLRDALKAYLAADALGNVMPLGVIVSEPTKAALVRDRVPLDAGLAAVAVENIFYGLSVALFILAGTLALLLSFSLPRGLRFASFAILCGVAGALLFGYVVLRQQWKFLSRTLAFFYARGIARRFLEARRGWIAALEERIYNFYARQRERLLPLFLLEACFHLAGVAEVYATLYLISAARPTWLAAFVLESVNRVINVVFKFVPLRVGVDEAGTGLLTSVLKLGTASGVTLAIIRKARVITWAGIGIAILVQRGLALRTFVDETPEMGATEADSKTVPPFNHRRDGL